MGSMMISPGIQSVIFDFDYTLADSSEGVIECANYALGRLGLPAASDDAIRHTIGLSLPNTLTALAGDEYAGHGEEFMRIFLDMAEKMMPDATAILDFVPSLADTLLGHGMTLGIVSSGRRWRISRVLRREGLDGQFKVIVGVEDVETPKPDPSGLLRAVDALNTPKERCLYVGDSVTDAETALRACALLRRCRALPSGRRLRSMSRRWRWGVLGNCRLHWDSTQAVYKEGLSPARLAAEICQCQQ